MTGIILMILGGILIIAAVIAAVLVWRILERKKRELYRDFGQQ